MADSIEVIEEMIETQIAADPNIEVLDTNPSLIAMFKNFRHAIAFVLNFFQRQQDDYETRIVGIVNTRELYTDEWWQEQMFAYQYGDLLLFINKVFQYAIVDPTKCPIQLCTPSGSGGVITLKCASLVGGVPQQLTISQQAGAQSYAEQKRPCGLDVVVQSYPADLLKLYFNIYYDPQLDESELRVLVEAAINNYINTLSTINFNGVFYVNKLFDALQVIPGVIKDQVIPTELAAKSTIVAYADFTSHYQSVAGYMVIDPDFPLSSTITLIPA